jgi:hypothetical protein
MALEDLTGTKYLDALVITNPVTTDFKNQGDDHIRGIKNVLKKTFANITGAVTATHTQLNLLTGLTVVPKRFIGEIFLWPAGVTLPTGYLQCNGALVNRTTYAALFAVIGTTFGAGDGSTTFALPTVGGVTGAVGVIIS